MVSEVNPPEMSIAIIAITRNGALIGKNLRQKLEPAELYVSAHYGTPDDQLVRLFEPAGLKELLHSLWNRVDGFVFIMATGIVVRLIAPLLQSKDIDPAVVIMDNNANFAISLLSGHLGGANELAGRCAAITGARAVITTATDGAGLPSFDLLAKEQKWAISDITKVKVLNSLLLDDREIAVVDTSGQTLDYFHDAGRLRFHDTFASALESRADGFLFVTNRLFPPGTLPEQTLILRPRNLVLGIGCNRGTPAEEIEAFVISQLRRMLLAPESLHSIGTAEAKRKEPGLLAFADQHRLPLQFYSSTELSAVSVPTPPSPHVLRAIGATGVAEPAAVLAARGGSLLLNKVKSANVTLAIAELRQVQEETCQTGP